MKSYQETLKDIAANDPDVMVLVAENHSSVRSIVKDLGNQFIDVGICEQNMLGIAQGLSLRGKKPVLHALSNFLIMRPFEWIRNAALHEMNITLVGAAPGLLSQENGYMHQAIEDLALIKLCGKNTTCMSPLCEENMGDMLKIALEHKGVSYIRYNNISDHNSVSTGLSIGCYDWVSSGKDGYIFTHGCLSNEVNTVIKSLSGTIDLGLIRAPIVYPVDEEMVIEVAKNKTNLFIIEDHVVSGGLCEWIRNILQIHGMNNKVYHIGISNTGFAPSDIEQVKKYEKLDSESIIKKIKKYYE